jgi:heme biosynthesis (nirJ-2) family protein
MENFTTVYSKPQAVTMLLTNDCNLACSYCFESNKGKDYMPKEMALDILKATYNVVDPMAGIFTLNMFGGEPLMNWDTFKAVCDYVLENNLKIRITATTNLTLLTDEMIDYIDELSIPVLVSVDGIKEVHDKHRCNSFDKVIENMKKLIDRDLGYLIEARMTVAPDTAKYMYESVKMLVDLGINNIANVPASDLEWDAQSIQDYKDNYEKILDMYIDILNDETNKRNISLYKVDQALNLALEPIKEDTSMCNIGNPRWVIVDWKGDIWPCPDYPTTDNADLIAGKIGNFYTGVDETKVDPKPMVATYELERCKGCEAISICKSGCPYENYTKNGKFNEPTIGYCTLQKAFVEIIKAYQDKLLEATNIRSRQLNVLIENLKVKKYYDEKVKTISITDREFGVRLNHFVEKYENLNNKGNVLPSFDTYFRHELMTVNAIIAALVGKKVEFVED